MLRNSQTFTRPAATNIVTITPKPSSLIATTTITRTFTTWTRTEKKDTVVVTPLCTVPAKPMLPDGVCKIVPTIKPVPQGVRIAAAGQERRIVDHAVDIDEVRKRFEKRDAAQSRVAALTASSPAVQAPPPIYGDDQATLTITAKYPINSTTTTTLPVKTLQILSTKTQISVVTAPPRTVFLGTAMQTISAPAKTVTQYRKAFTRVYEVQTMSVAWTWTSTASSGAKESEECRAQGGWMGF